MKMKMFMVALLAFVGLSATAQRQEKVVDRVDQRTVQEFDHKEVTRKFKSHLFLDVQGGAQYTLGEAKFGDLISPNVQLGLGYQFNPWFAGRIQVNGWQSKGGWNTRLVNQWSNYRAELSSNTYKYKYVAPGIDLIFSLTDLIGGWNPDRFFNLAVFVGGGANIGFDNDEAVEIDRVLRDTRAYGTSINNLEYLWDGTKVNPFGRGGIQLGFRLSPAIKLILEGNANILTDKYNSKKADNADWYFNALVGLKVNLGKSYTTVLPPPPAPEPEPYVEPEPEPAPAPVVEKIEPIRRDIFFLINKTDIRESEAPKVKDIADYLVKYPKAKVVVNGYADAGTGNDKINDRLAALRADVVVKALKEQYGIAESRITYDSHGSRVQPFAENDMNRVSICIAE